MASSIGKCGVSEDALIWAKVKKVLAKKGPLAAQEALRSIRLEQIMDKLDIQVTM